MSDPIRKLTLKDGSTRYRVIVDVGIHPDGRRDQRTKTFRTLTEARKYLTATRAQVDSGTYIAPSKLTLSAYLRQWLAGKRNLKANSRSGYRLALRHIHESCGHLPLVGLTKADIDAVATTMHDNGKSPQPSSRRSRSSRKRSTPPCVRASCRATSRHWWNVHARSSRR